MLLKVCGQTGGVGKQQGEPSSWSTEQNSIGLMAVAVGVKRWGMTQELFLM